MGSRYKIEDYPDYHGALLASKVLGARGYSRKDFNVEANSRGYQIQYRGQNIGGAGISASARGATGKAAYKQVQDYLRMGNAEIEAILTGRGQKRFYEAMGRIDRGLIR